MARYDFDFSGLDKIVLERMNPREYVKNINSIINDINYYIEESPKYLYNENFENQKRKTLKIVESFIKKFDSFKNDNMEFRIFLRDQSGRIENTHEKLQKAYYEMKSKPTKEERERQIELAEDFRLMPPMPHQLEIKNKIDRLIVEFNEKKTQAVKNAYDRAFKKTGIDYKRYIKINPKCTYSVSPHRKAEEEAYITCDVSYYYKDGNYRTKKIHEYTEMTPFELSLNSSFNYKKLEDYIFNSIVENKFIDLDRPIGV
jgi:hypothetical protein